MKSQKRTNTAKWIESAHRWQINVQKNGVRKTFVSAKPGRTGQREANAKADAWLEQGLQTRQKTVGSAYGEFLERARKVSSKSNWRPMESRWRTWIGPRIGRLRLEGLTTRQVQDILDDAKAAGRSRKYLSNIMGDLTAFFKYCRKAGYSTFIPDDLVIPAGAPRGEKTILQPVDLVKLLNFTETSYRGKTVPDELVHVYRLAVLTGLRPGELLGLRWADVQGDTVTVRGAVNVYGERTRGKNDNAIRRFELSALARQEMDAQRTLTGRLEYVAPQIREQHLLNRWRRFCAHNGITPVTLYEMRHTFVSIAQQLPEGQLKALVGHSRSMDTFGIYGHHVDGQEADAAAQLDEIFAGIVGG